MFAPVSLRPRQLGGGASCRQPSLALVLIVCALLLSGCFSTPPPVPLTGPDPTDPGARVPAAAYRPVTAPYRSQRPVEPRPWVEQNQSVAPAEKP
jgi:hypothetical protein